MSAYKPGDLIEIKVSDDPDRWSPRALNSDEQFVYVGEWAGKIFVGCSEEFDPFDIEPEYVRPYTPPIEIPEGWTLMRTDELEMGVHAVYDPADPDGPWDADYTIIDGYSMLVVARRRADA